MNLSPPPELDPILKFVVVPTESAEDPVSTRFPSK